MGSTDPVTAIVERMMERLQKENPSVNYKRKGKKPKSERRPRRKSVH